MDLPSSSHKATTLRSAEEKTSSGLTVAYPQRPDHVVLLWAPPGCYGPWWNNRPHPYRVRELREEITSPNDGTTAGSRASDYLLRAYTPLHYLITQGPQLRLHYPGHHPVATDCGGTTGHIRTECVCCESPRGSTGVLLIRQGCVKG